MSKISVSLPDALNTFVQSEVASGRYDSPSQYLEYLVRQAQKRKARKAVDRLLLQGIKSGKSTVMTSEDWKSIRREVDERAARRNGR